MDALTLLVLVEQEPDTHVLSGFWHLHAGCMEDFFGQDVVPYASTTEVFIPSYPYVCVRCSKAFQEGRA